MFPKVFRSTCEPHCYRGKKKEKSGKTVSPILETEFNQGKTVEDVVQHFLPGR